MPMPRLSSAPAVMSWAARQAKLSGWKLAAQVLGPTWLACLPLLLLIALERTVPLLDFRDSIPLFVLEGGAAFLIAAWGLWRLALTELERDKLAGLIGKLRARRTPA